jgi:predicted permease
VSSSSGFVRLARSLHRASLIVHPAAFREEFSVELLACFERQTDEAYRRRGSYGVAVVLVRTLVDTLVTAASHRTALGVPLTKTRNLVYGRGGGEVIGTLIRDTVVATRTLIRRPVFAAVAAGTLALGIGANTAIFSVVNGVLLKPLPFPDSEQLVRLYYAERSTGFRRASLSLPDREDLAARSTSLSHVAVYSTLPSGLLLTGGDEAIEVRTAYVSAGFFGALGRDAYLGRVLLDAEERGDNHVVVLSHGFWERRFGGNESIVGSTIQLDDTGFLVVGVMPPDFGYPTPDVEAWVFLTVIPPSSIPLHIREVRFLEAVGRIEAGTTRAQSAEELAAVAASLVADYPEDNEDRYEIELVPLRESMTAGVEPTLLVLLGAVGLVLLIACANVANLLLSRGVERGPELIVRRALGAGRGRLVRQLMTETVLLSMVGGAAGVALAVWGTSTLISRSQGLLPRSGEIETDLAVLGFAVVITSLTSIASGLLPALKLTEGGGGEELHLAQRGGASRSGVSRASAAVVASQVSLAILVVIGSGLVLRSLWALQSVDVGMESDRLVALSLTINDARYPERADYLAAYDELMTGLERLPSVASVGSIRYLPLRGSGEQTEFDIVGRPGTGSGDRPGAWVLQVSPGFFRTAGVPLIAGREFTGEEGPDTPPVIVINDALRRRYWPGETPVGAFIDGNGWNGAEIVGVAGDVRQQGLAEDPPPTIYVAQAQGPRRGMSFVMRTQSDPEQLLPDVRATVQSIDPDQPIDELATMNEVVRSSTAQPRFFSLLLGSFAVLALMLASFGIYGVVSYSVSRRVSEIGIRVALGAPSAGVVGLVVRGGMRPVLIGAVIGLVASVGAARALNTILFGVSTHDPVTFAVVPVLLIAIALLACWLPAWRAVRVDPTEALRVE